MPTYNKRFCEMAAEVFTQAALKRFTVRDCPNCVQLNRHFAKPPLRCATPCGSDSTKHRANKRKKITKKNANFAGQINKRK